MKSIIAELARIFREKHIPYMLMGGHAVISHGQPRFTDDIDITLSFPKERYKEIINMLSENFEPLFGNLDEFIDKSWVLPMQFKPKGVIVDVLFSDTVFESEAIKEGVKEIIEGEEVNFISAENLIVQKIFAGRTKDIADVETILTVKRDKLDYARIEERIRAFDRDMGQTDLFELWKEVKKRILD
jgi:hypothetical protein